MSVLEVRLTQLLAALGGVAVVVVALLMWGQADEPSGRTVVKATSTTTPAIQRRTTRAPTSSYTVETTTTVDGTAGPGERVGPMDAAARRSETVTLLMVGGGLLLVLVALLYPRLRGASGAGAALSLDPISLTRRRARERQAADSRLPQNLEELASDLLQARFESRTRSAASRAATDVAGLSSLIDEAITAFVDRPQARDGHERYRGDYVVLEDSNSPNSASPIGRILFYPSGGARFDVVRAGRDVNWGADEAKRRTVRLVLQHASGNQAPAESVVDQFLSDHPDLLIAGKPWTVALADILQWIDSHWEPASVAPSPST